MRLDWIGLGGNGESKGKGRGVASYREVIMILMMLMTALVLVGGGHCFCHLKSCRIFYQAGRDSLDANVDIFSNA